MTPEENIAKFICSGSGLDYTQLLTEEGKLNTTGTIALMLIIVRATYMIVDVLNEQYGKKA